MYVYLEGRISHYIQPDHTQVVAISTMVHTGVNVDGPTDTTPQHIRQGTSVYPPVHASVSV